MLFGLGDIRMRRIFIEQEESGEDRKRREHQRLAALVGYCESPGCRRQVLLGYFGEAAEPCCNCDVCLDPVALTDGTAEAVLLLLAIQSSGERFGAGHIVDIVLGAQTAKIIGAGHDRLRVFGSGASRRKEEWRSFLRHVVFGGLVSQGVDGYGGLRLTEQGRTVLRGERSFQYRPEKVRGAVRKERQSNIAHFVTQEQSQLLVRLKKLRLEIAGRRHLPAYLIFSDRTLTEMAKCPPKDLHEFALINGVGASKLRDFGQIFVNAIQNHRDPSAHDSSQV